MLLYAREQRATALLHAVLARGVSWSEEEREMSEAKEKMAGEPRMFANM